jgi:phosphoglycolate phosphatase-like HAD superfamily hydrolase
MQMGRAAGIEPWGVCWGYHRPEALIEAGATCLFSSTDDLLLALQARRGVARAQMLA